MPLQTAPFPIVLFLIFFIVPIIILLGIIVGIFYYFWRFRGRTKFVMIGAAALLLYGLGMTALFVGASSHNRYYLEVTACDQHQLTGLTEDGKSTTLYFPRWFGSGQSSWGEGPTIKTINKDTWSSEHPLQICEQVLGTKTWFDTDGLRRIELVKFLEPEPLIYLLPDEMEVLKTSEISFGWFDQKNSNLFDRVTDCQNLAKTYNDKNQTNYAFLADIEKLQQQNQDPANFAFRIYLLPNLTGYKNLDDLIYDWESCYSPEHINSFPILVSPSWIAFVDGCEGVFDGCITAQDAITESLDLIE